MSELEDAITAQREKVLQLATEATEMPPTQGRNVLQRHYAALARLERLVRLDAYQSLSCYWHSDGPNCLSTNPCCDDEPPCSEAPCPRCEKIAALEAEIRGGGEMSRAMPVEAA